jgi:SNF2 family DNA or RNA helicase
MTYSFKTEPYDHQRTALALLEGKEYFALFMEQGTGKTKVLLDDAGRLFTENRIDGLIVLADNGIHRNWISDEAPAHLNVPWSGLVWSSGKANAQYFQLHFAMLCLAAGELPILAMNIDAVITPNGKKALNTFLNARQSVMVIVDESTSIKTPGAKRTKTTVALGKHATYRRIATGTPYAEGPLDIYAPCRFLNDDILGCRSFMAFKHEYAEWEPRQTQTGRTYQVLLCYRNLERLKTLLAPHSYRVLKADCLDLPEKVYQKRYFELGKEQRRVYEKLREEFILEMSEGDIAVNRTMTRRMRLQQIASGFTSTDAKEPATWLPDNARLRAFDEYTKGLPEGTKCIVWARFRPDIDALVNLLGDRAVRYDGSVSADDRANAIRAFQEGNAQYFVGTARAGGKGLTLTAAQQVLYYTNDDPLIHRLQSEDRAHRIGQKNTVVYVDFVGVDTVDESLVTALREKKDISDLITGDPKGPWL